MNQTTPDRPKDVETSFRLWIAAIVLGIVSVVLSVLLVDEAIIGETRRQLEAQGQQLTDEQLRAFVTTAKIVGAVFLVVVYGLWLLFVMFMRKGKNWARILLTVMTGIWLLLTVPGLAAQSPVSLIISIVQIGLVVGATIFMFRPAANEYFNSAKRTV